MVYLLEIFWIVVENLYMVYFYDVVVGDVWFCYGGYVLMLGFYVIKFE